MKQSFLFIYFVLYLVAIVALIPAAGGGRIPCNALADSLARVYAEPLGIDVPAVIRTQLPRLTMGERVLEKRVDTTIIRIQVAGLISPEERQSVTYIVEPIGNAPALSCSTNPTTGTGTIAHAFEQTGTFRYKVIARVRRSIPENLPRCVKELLTNIEGKQLETEARFEVTVRAVDFRTPC